MKCRECLAACDVKKITHLVGIRSRRFPTYGRKERESGGSSKETRVMRFRQDQSTDDTQLEKFLARVCWTCVKNQSKRKIYDPMKD